MSGDDALSTPLPPLDDILSAAFRLFEDGFDLAGAVKIKMRSLVVGEPGLYSPLCGVASLGVTRLLGTISEENPPELDPDTKMRFKYEGALRAFSYSAGTALSLASGMIHHKVVLTDIAHLPPTLTLVGRTEINTKGDPEDDAVSLGIEAGNLEAPFLYTLTGSLKKAYKTSVVPEVKAVFGIGHRQRGLVGFGLTWDKAQCLEDFTAAVGYVDGRNRCLAVGLLDSESGKHLELAYARSVSDLVVCGACLKRDACGAFRASTVWQIADEGMGLSVKGRGTYSKGSGFGVDGFVEQRLWGSVTAGFSVQYVNSIRYGFSLVN